MATSLESELKIALAEKDQALAEKDSALAEKDQTIRFLTAKLEELADRVAKLQRKLYGRSSEKSELLESPPPPGPQQDLFAEDSPIDEPPQPTPEEMCEEATEPRRPHRASPVRKPLPANLKRLDVEIDISESEKLCPCCGRPRVRIGEDVTEQLEIVPQTLHVKRIIRPRYACGGCREGVVQAALPNAPIPRASASSSLLAWLLISKYEDHLPLCRIERIMGRLGIEMPRSKTSEWMMQLADLLAPLIELMRREVLAKSAVIGADETPIQVLNSAGKTVSQGWLWVYRGDASAPYTIFDFNESRGAARPREILTGYSGWLVTDGYAVYQSIAKDLQKDGHPVYRPVACWAHARRHFVDALKGGDNRAAPMIELIGRLYAIERDAAGLDPPERLARRQTESIPILAEIKSWLQNNVTALPKSPLGKAIGYALDRWEGLTVYTTDGRLPIDNNAVERSVRPAALGRKNWLFAGSPRGAAATATFLTLLDSAKRAGVNLWEYVTDLLTRIASHPVNRLHELLPNNWKPAAATQAQAQA